MGDHGDRDDYDDSAASSGTKDEEVLEAQQDKAEQGAAQGGKGRVE